MSPDYVSTIISVTALVCPTLIPSLLPPLAGEGVVAPQTALYRPEILNLMGLPSGTGPYRWNLCNNALPKGGIVSA